MTRLQQQHTRRAAHRAAWPYLRGERALRQDSAQHALADAARALGALDGRGGLDLASELCQFFLAEFRAKMAVRR